MYNKCLRKTKYIWTLKIDGDQIYDTQQLLNIRNKILSDTKNKHIIETAYSLSGINVCANNGDFYFPSKLVEENLSMINGLGDHLVCKKRFGMKYIPWDWQNNGKNIIERFRVPYLDIVEYGICWFHFGYLKHGALPKNTMKKETKFDKFDISIFNDVKANKNGLFPPFLQNLFSINGKYFGFKDIDVIERLKLLLSKENYKKFTKNYGKWIRSNLQ